jgi:hypothetical protein
MRLDPATVDVPEQFGKARRKDYWRARRRAVKAANPTLLAVLDMETPPFGCDEEIKPFLAVLYTAENTVVIWDENPERLIQRVYDAILALPGKYIVYAHNGGRFDFMFMIRELRGKVMFKGRSLMSAMIGPHELRDSFHIIPEKLKNANRKTEIDYNLFKRGSRNRHRDIIIAYCIDDCTSLYELVASFWQEFGTPLTIGQAALRELKKHYQFDRLSEATDAYFRSWFYGGRVECIRSGLVIPAKEPFNLYDVNSMYPYVMANYQHPISASFHVRDRITPNTIFLTIRCKNNGALVSRKEDGGLTTKQTEGIFNVTIWEYEVAMKHRLIADVEVIRTIEFPKTTDFSNFIMPQYDGRQRSKELIADAKRNGDYVSERIHSRDSLFKKLLMNNGYGKLAQNPRNFKVHYVTDPMDIPPPDNKDWRELADLRSPDDYRRAAVARWGDMPVIETEQHWIWCHPADDFRFNNVATAASITGAARAVLLGALATCHDPLYCDTDSIICKRLGDNQEIHATKLGAWDIEAQVSAYIGAGKKLYAYHDPNKEYRDETEKKPCSHCGRVHPGCSVKAKGTANVTWQDMLELINGKRVTKRMFAPIINKDGSQTFLTRELRATAVDLQLPALN